MEANFKGIEYKVDNPAYCSLTLSFIKPRTDLEAVSQISVNFHADSDIPDFIVLASKVKKALRNIWTVGRLMLARPFC